MKSKFGRILKKIVIWAMLLFFGGSIGFTILYRFINPPITPLMIVRLFDYKEGNTARLTKKWVSLEDISPHLYNAAIASEDNLFLQHHGFDFKAIEDAQEYNKRHKGRRMRGASTISQQTAKNVFLWTKRSWLRKGMEVYFTFLIETLWSKERIMEVYLNVIEMGQGVYGAERASEIYYKKSAKKMTKGEAALLVACLPDPRRRRPDRPTNYLFKRQSQILNLMNKTERMTLSH